MGSNKEPWTLSIGKDSNGCPSPPFGSFRFLGMGLNTTDRWIRVNVAWSDSDWLFDLPIGSRLGWIELLCYTKRDGIAGKVKAMSDKVASRKWRITELDVSTLLFEAVKDSALMIEEGYWTVSNWKEYQGTDISRVERWREERRKKESKKEEEKDRDIDSDIDIDSKGVTLPPVTDCYVTERNKPLRNVTPKKEKPITPTPSVLELRDESQLEQDAFILKFNKYCHECGSLETDNLEKDRGSMMQMLTNGLTLKDLEMMLKWLKGDGAFDWIPNYIGTFRELTKIANGGKGKSYYKTIHGIALAASMKPGKKGSITPTSGNKEQYIQDLKNAGVIGENE